MWHVAVIAQTTGAADIVEQRWLSLNEGDQVLRVRRFKSERDRPICYEVLVLPLERFPGLSGDREITEELVDLARSHGVVLGAARETFEDVYPTAEVAAQLGIETDEAVLKLERVVRRQDGPPVEWRIAFCLELQEF